jgi:hypothetical protein
VLAGAAFPNMPKRCAPPDGVIAWCSFLACAATLLLAPVAHAEFSSPPESPYPAEPRYRGERPATLVEDPGERWPAANEESTLRLHVGPAMLLEPSGPGLFTALDVGRRAVGARVSAAWLRAESERGLAAYEMELWIDFRHRYDLHPILGAGASLLRGGALGDASSVGAGVLRGALEYELPVEGADARVGLNLTAFVPAIGTDRTKPWAAAALTIGAGF